MNKNLVVSALTMLVMGTIATYSAPSVLADWLIDRSGTIMEIDPSVLGDEDVSDDLEETKNVETNREGTKNQSEMKREQLKQREELSRETSKNQKEQTREVAKQVLERKIKLNQINNKNVENKYELSERAGELKVKQTTRLPGGKETERELELKENETLHVEQEDGESVDIDTRGRGVLEIRKDQFTGRTRLPMSVNANNELVVTRPDGTTKTVTVLPDEAVTKMLEKGILTTSEDVELTTGETGDPVYQVKQEVSKKLFGLIPMKFGTETNVSASDPNDVATSSTETSPWRRFLQRLSR